MSQRLERLVNLTATLLDTRRPLTLDELADRLEPSYPDDKIARRRAFERDKETMRDLGIPISVESIDAFGGEVGYCIHPGDYYLPELDLTTDERAALHVAVSAVRLEGADARAGLRKLGGLEGTGAPPLAQLEGAPFLAECFDAVARHRRLTFGYRGETRTLEPYGIVHRFGHWYVVGHDLGRDGPRAFRVDRFDATPEAGEPGAFETPAGTDPAAFVRDDPLAYGDAAPETATVLVAASRAPLVVDELGEDAVIERHDDGSVLVELHVVNREAFRTWVLGLLEHAEVVAPPGLRADLVGWLEAVEAANAGDAA
ncbi:MAG TPA: WYL domain-containing transcriptional regulator [Acidimicrobiia bacterium]